MNPVQNFEIFAPKLIDRKEYLSPGHRACQGCGEVLALRHILKALGDDIVVANATGCMEIISSGYPQTAWEVPYVHVAFENAAAVGSGVEAALKALRRKGRIADRDVKTIADSRRRRHCRHRPAGPLRRHGARPRHDLLLPRQRGLHEHGHPALERHPLHGGHDDLTRRARPSRARERRRRTSPRSWWPTRSPTWPRPARATRSI